MKKLILALVFLVPGMVLRAQTVINHGYWLPGSQNWVKATDTTYMSPYRSVSLNYLNPSTELSATALDNNPGWKVEAWYCTDSIHDSTGGSKVDNSEGKATLTWVFDENSEWDCLSVKYAYISYRASYVGAGTGVPSGTTTYGYTNEFVIASAPARTGWTFVGWQDGKGALHQPGDCVTGELFSELDDVHDDMHTVTLTAQWDKQAYEVVSAATHGSVTISPGSPVDYTNDVTISWAPGTASGQDYSLTSVKVYAGATAGETVLATYTSGTQATFNMSKLSGGKFYSSVFVEVIYACTPHVYSVDVRAGSHGTVEQTPSGTSFAYESKLQLVAKPSDGYAFEKWSDGSTDANRLLTVTDNVSLQATFTNRVYTLTLKANGGKFTDESEQKTLLVRYGDYIEALPTKAEVAQYLKTLKGWFTADSGGTQVDSTRQYDWTNDVTLFAQWADAETFVVKVEANPAEGGTVEGGGNFEQDSVTTLKATPNEGYSFAGWNDGGAQKHEVTVNANAKYVATFTGNVYKVRFYWFDIDVEGSITPNVRSYTFGSPYGELPVAIPDSPDFQFAGWVDDDENEITTNSVMNMSGKNNCLYALVRQRPSYTIRFDGNGAPEGEMLPQKAYCGEDTPLTPNAYLWPGHKFLNWTNEMGKVFKDGQTVRDLVEDKGEVFLFAVWKELTLAEAMHCENLKWTNQVVDENLDDSELWKVQYGENVGSNSWSCVRQSPSWGTPHALTSDAVTSAGTLTFYWKPTNGSSGLIVWEDELETPETVGKNVLTGEKNVWQHYTLHVEAKDSKTYIHIVNWDLDATIDIDQMTWTPASPDPQRGEAVTIKSASVADGVFKLGVEGESGVNYGVWTNADLRVPVEDWGFMTNRLGEGVSFEFELKILPDEPQLFYGAFEVH